MTHTDLIALLARSLPDLRPIAPCSFPRRWQFSLLAGAKARASVEIVGNWAIVRSALPRASADTAFESILRQSAWQGGAKLVVTQSRLALGAEVPLVTDTVAGRDWVAHQVRQVLAGIRTATGHCEPEALPADVAGVDSDLEMLAERCSAAGWPAVVKADGDIQVALESRSIRRVASIVRNGHGLRAAVTLGGGGLARASAVSQQAAGVFLLRASSSLRWVRAWASGNAGEPYEAGFECLFIPASESTPLVTAIDALATACDLFGCEAEALFADSGLARQYLDIVGPCRVSFTKSAAHRITSDGSAAVPFAAAAATLA